MKIQVRTPRNVETTDLNSETQSKGLQIQVPNQDYDQGERDRQALLGLLDGLQIRYDELIKNPTEAYEQCLRLAKEILDRT